MELSDKQEKYNTDEMDYQLPSIISRNRWHTKAVNREAKVPKHADIASIIAFSNAIGNALESMIIGEVKRRKVEL